MYLVQHVMCQALRGGYPGSQNFFLNKTPQRVSLFCQMDPVFPSWEPLRGHNIDVFRLDSAKNVLSLVKVEFLLPIVGQKGSQLQSSLDADGHFVHRSLENLAAYPPWEDIDSFWLLAE